MRCFIFGGAILILHIVDFPVCCGRSWRQFARVVGGRNSKKNAWPWQVLIAHSNSSILETLAGQNVIGGGSILNQKWVLSAAHILYYGEWPNKIILFAGITKRPSSGTTVGESVVAYSVKMYHKHEDYRDDGSYRNDIALIEVGYKLDGNLRRINTEIAGFTFEEGIKPVCLPDQSLLREGTNVIVTGFGHTTARNGTDSPKIIPSKTLQEASLQIASNITCRNHVEQINRDTGAAFEFTESMLCTEPAKRDACHGDSGGPLVLNVNVTDENKEETQWVQVGIVSFGYGCAWRHPGYYTKVASFIPWINQRIKEILCPLPESGPNQYVVEQIPDKKWRVGDVATYKCDSGYEFNGEQPSIRLACGCDGAWEGPVIPCKEDIKCGEPPSVIANGRRTFLSLNPLKPKAKATYKCNDGYKIEGKDGVISQDIQCFNNEEALGSKWVPSASNVTCIRVRCAAPKPGINQQLDERTWYAGDIARYRCDEGHKFDTTKSPNVTCQNDGSWSGEPPNCVEDLECVEPERIIKNGSRTSMSEIPLLPNATAIYKCKPGYKMNTRDGSISQKVHCRRRSGDRLGSEWVPNISNITCVHTPRMLDLMILIPGNRNHSNTEKNAYKHWLKVFGNYITSSHAYTLAIYQYGREYYQNKWRDLILERKLPLNGTSSFQFQSRIDSLSLTQQYAYPRLYPKTMTIIGSTPWGKRKSSARKKILIILVERTRKKYRTKRINDSVNCMEYKGISVYFIGVKTSSSGNASTFETLLKEITGSLNTERNFHMAGIQQLAQRRSMQSLTEYIAMRGDSCSLPTDAPRGRSYTCRWKSSTENTFHPGDKLFYECQWWRSSSWHERKRHKLCKADGTWVFVNKNPCGRE